MEINVNLSHSNSRMKDFFSFHLFRRSPSRYIYYALMLISLIVGIIFLFQANYIYAIFFVVIAILFLLIRVITIKYTINQIMKSMKKVSFKYSLKFLDDRLIYEVKEKLTEYIYSDLTGVYETSSYLYVYYSKDGAVLVFKEELKDSDLESLRMKFKESNKYHRVLF